jgi:hypothetical protein
VKQKAYKLIFNPSAGYGRKRFTWLNRCLSKNKAPTNNDQTLTLIKKIWAAGHQYQMASTGFSQKRRWV